MANITELRSLLSPCKRDLIRWWTCPALRVFICIMSLSGVISAAKELDLSSGRGTMATSSATKPTSELNFLEFGRHKLKDSSTHKKQADSSMGSDKPQNKTGSFIDEQRGDELLKKTTVLSGRTDESFQVLSQQKEKLYAVDDLDDSWKTLEQEWDGEMPTSRPPYVLTSQIVDIDEYYTYDYFGDENKSEEEKEDDDDDSDQISEGRRKKDTSSYSNTNSESLDLLARLGTNQDLVYLGTPNPNIEITIEVINEEKDAVDGDTLTVSMDLTDDAINGDVESRDGRNKARGENVKDSLAKPTGDTVTDEDSLSWSEYDDGEDSYLFFEFAPLRLLPDPENFEPVTSEEQMGTWTGWSLCSASCGGGRSERSRSCGFSCTATESKDCNQQSCPRRVSEPARAEPEGALVSTPRLPSLDTAGYLNTFLDPQNFDTDSCEEWMVCRSETLLSYLSRLQDLPNCPCYYPTNLHQNNAIWDRQKRMMFHWVDASGEDANLDVYKPTASYCIVSMLSPHSTSLTAQQCCYGSDHRLVTRGPGAGTPQLISAEISRELHHKIDIMPWIICKGDWTKYNKVRHPNNMWDCSENPDEADFYQLFKEAKNF